MLLSLCLFNLAGYGWLFDYLEAQTEQKLVQQLDRNEYEDTQLIELKFPFQVPYNNDWPDYRREDGEIEINGKFYSYVKIKISQDTIYLKCLPNQNKNKLVAARQDINKKLNHLPGGEEDAPSSIVKKASLLFGFSQKISAYQIEAPFRLIYREYDLFSPNEPKGFTGEPLHPPTNA